MNPFAPSPAIDLSRRRFVQGVAIGGAAAGLGLLRPSNAWALTSPGQPKVLSGTDFALDIVFDTDPAIMWETAIRRMGADPSTLQMSHGVH